MAFISSFEDDLPSLFETGSVNEPDFPYDIQLVTSDGRIVLGHKVVLQRGSDFFKVMFSGKHKEANQSVVNMNNLDADSLHMIVGYFYNKRHEITEDNVFSVLETASYLLVQEIVDACCCALIDYIDVNNCFMIEAVADLHSCTWLKTLAEKYILLHFPEAAITNDFLDVKFNKIRTLLNSDGLVVPNEDFLLERITNWIMYDFKDRNKYIVEILDALNLELISLNSISNFIKKFPVIKKMSHRILHVQKNYNSLFKNVTNKYARFTEYPRIYKEESLLIIGGTLRIDMKSNIETYDGVNRRWRELVDISLMSKSFLNSVMMYNRKKKCHEVMVFGGRYSCLMEPCRSADIIDLKDYTIRNTNFLHIGRYYLGAAVFETDDNTYVYAIGGCTVNLYSYTNCVEKWDLKRGHWVYVSSLQTGRANFGVAVLDDKIYVAGGNVGKLKMPEVTDSVEVFCTKTEEWKSCAPMLQAKCDLTLVAAGRFLYAIGGCNGDVLSMVERYDPELDVWTHITDLPGPRRNVGACFYNGKIVVCGGLKQYGTLDDVFHYNIKKNKWTYNTSLLCKRWGAICLSYNTNR